MGLYKEIWLDVIKEQLDQVPSFLSEVSDLSQFVDNDKLHIAEAGVDPEVFINLKNYPIPVVDRIDTPHELALDTADTQNVPIRNAEKAQLSYDKMASITRRMAAALTNFMAGYATFNFTPVADTEFTPVIPTSGTSSFISGLKDLTENDILLLKHRFDKIRAPRGKRTLVLHEDHMNSLLASSPILKEQQKYLGKIGEIDIIVYFIHGFKVYEYTSEAVFNKNNGQKKAWNAVADDNTDVPSSFAFVGTEVMKAMGSRDMFSALNDPHHRADIMGFQQRFAVLPMRNKFIASIYSAPTA